MKAGAILESTRAAGGGIRRDAALLRFADRMVARTRLAVEDVAGTFR